MIFISSRENVRNGESRETPLTLFQKCVALAAPESHGFFRAADPQFLIYPADDGVRQLRRFAVLLVQLHRPILVDVGRRDLRIERASNSARNQRDSLVKIGR